MKSLFIHDFASDSFYLSLFDNAFKVHENENFFGFDFEFCTISLLVMQCINKKIFGKKLYDWTIMGGATIIPRSLKTTQNENNFQDRPKMKEKKSYMTL
jgi:hypothetical protein